MKKEIFLYTLSTALSRGSLLIFFPIVSSMLTISDFGIWSLALVSVNLIIPVLCLNGQAAILREGSENLDYAYKLILYYACITIFISTISYFLLYNFDNIFWLKTAIIIAFFESLILLFTTALRVFEKSIAFFLINLLKTTLIFFAIVYAKINNYTLDDLLIVHCLAVLIAFFFTLLYFFYFFFKVYIVKDIAIPPAVLRLSIFFSVSLIPHGVSQWLMSSSDRFILKVVTTSTELGEYSLAYSLALILGLLNTAIGLMLPVYVIKNYEKWTSNNYDQKIIMIYTLVAVSFFVLIITGYIIDWKYFHILKHYDYNIIVMYYILFNSLYLLGIYYFFVNYLFYHRKSKQISMTTLLVALINIILTIGFSYAMGAIGAALATFISYIVYLLIIRKLAINIEKNIKINIFKPISIMFVTSSIITLGVYVIV